MIANSELAIQKGDFDGAIKILADVPPESPAYLTVQVGPPDSPEPRAREEPSVPPLRSTIVAGVARP